MARALPGDGPGRCLRGPPGHRLPAAARRGPRPRRRGLQLLPAPGLRPVRAGVPHGHGRAVRPGARPRAALHGRARGARRRRARAGPHGVPRAGEPADGGAAVGGGAPAPARRPRRQGHRRLVRGAPRPRLPRRAGHRRPPRPRQDRVHRGARAALPAGPGRPRRRHRRRPQRGAGGHGGRARRAARRVRAGRDAPRADPGDRPALGDRRAAAGARAQPRRPDARARGVRGALHRRRT